ncbi:MAG TPA: guanylate kinase [Polyangiaceae bacterium]|nr:guanylate kinase [Polyangiaceae bacterium]
MSNSSPLLFIVSSPSGAGKTTLTGRLMQNVSGLSFSVSHTTRRPRSNELDGREYHFVTRDQFVALIERGEFLEWAEVHGNLYGTSRAELARAQGLRGIIFDVDQQGARQIKSHLPDSVSVFILPPDMKTLHDRLSGRASEDAATVARRFGVALTEIAHYGLFDYLLVNDDLEDATHRLISIFRAEECRRHRSATLAEQLIADGRGFGGSRPPN